MLRECYTDEDHNTAMAQDEARQYVKSSAELFMRQPLPSALSTFKTLSRDSIRRKPAPFFVPGMSLIPSTPITNNSPEGNQNATGKRQHPQHARRVETQIAMRLDESTPFQVI